MTSSSAVIALGARSVGYGPRAISRSSRYPLEETIRRLESHAARLGLRVFARVSVPAHSGRHRQAAVLVLSPDTSHVAVLHSQDMRILLLPLAVEIDETPLGASEVYMQGDLAPLQLGKILDTEMLGRISSLPELVEAALQ
jgi:uncharacterized protein (DUF302 family)